MSYVWCLLQIYNYYRTYCVCYSSSRHLVMESMMTMVSMTLTLMSNTLFCDLHHIDQSIGVSRFRMVSHWLEVVSSSHVYIPRDQRLCTLCNSMIHEYELHGLKCAIYDELRREYGIFFICTTSFNTWKCSEFSPYVMSNSDNVSNYWKKFSIFFI